MKLLRFTTRLNLQLIAAHPTIWEVWDFEAALRGQLPFSFCLGVGLAGAVANRIFNEGQKAGCISSFALDPDWRRASCLRRTLFPFHCHSDADAAPRHAKLGALARGVGEQFEKKWLHRADSLTEDVLSVPDFSATTDLYSVVDNINRIRVIPVGAVDLYALIGVALIPAIPVVIASIPFDTVIRDSLKVLF